jgi:branched-chain amino acid transport system permease protein
MSPIAPAVDSTPSRVAPARPGVLRPQHLLVVAFLLAYPLVAADFWTAQIGAQPLYLGVIALSLMLLAGYGGTVSLAQMTVAGIAGYTVALLGTSAFPLSLGWPWWVVVPLATLVATLFAAVVGAIAVRTEGIYTIMITLAIAVATFYLALQNYTVFNGFKGFAGVDAPIVFDINWRDPVPFYYLCLAVAAAAYFAVLHLSRSTFGIALQAIRDNPRRMRSLGFNVTLHRIAAYAIAGFIASFGGILSVWYNGRVSPGSIGIAPVINVLVIAVLGGMRHPIGPFIGAIVFVLLQNFAIDFIDRERFNTLIGTIFLLIVLFSSDGLLGLWDTLRSRLRAGPSALRRRSEPGKSR